MSKSEKAIFSVEQPDLLLRQSMHNYVPDFCLDFSSSVSSCSRNNVSWLKKQNQCGWQSICYSDWLQ